MAKKQIEAIDKIIALLPELVVHTPSKKMREYYKILKRAIVRMELESVFKQPKTKEELEYRKEVDRKIEEFRKSDKVIIL